MKKQDIQYMRRLPEPKFTFSKLDELKAQFIRENPKYNLLNDCKAYKLKNQIKEDFIVFLANKIKE